MPALDPHVAMVQINDQLSHLWMVRTFLKHAPETEADEDLREISRVLYDYNLALGPSWASGDAATFLKLARKKLSKLRKANEEFALLQPEISTHTNFQMAALSLANVTLQIEAILGQVNPAAERTALVDPDAN